jgi:hypothetical protein
MNKYIIAAILAVAAVFGFAGGRIGVATAPVTGGYFGGGTPSNLVTGSASGGLTGNGYVSPVGSL